jgi:hypothetical protein
MKAYWGSGDIASFILDLGTRWRWVVSFTPRPLCFHEKSPWYPLDRRLGGPQSRPGRGGEEKNSQPLPGLGPPIIQIVSQYYTTELSRLLAKSVRYILFAFRLQWQTNPQQLQCNRSASPWLLLIHSRLCCLAGSWRSASSPLTPCLDVCKDGTQLPDMSYTEFCPFITPARLSSSYFNYWVPFHVYWTDFDVLSLLNKTR